MKKHYLLLVIVILLVITSAGLVSAAKKTPPGRATTTSTTGSTGSSSSTAATTPQIVERVIVQNNTQTIVAQQSGLDWQMIGTVIAIIAAIGGWLISRKVRGKTAKYMTEIDKAYRTYRKNANKCEAELASVREKIEEDFKKGKINDNSLAILDARIDKYSKELRSEVIDKGFKLPPDLNKKIKHMLSDGIITKEEYEHFAKGIDNEQLSKQDREELSRLMKKWRDEDKR